MIDTIKTRVEAACSATVSCADILALAAKDAVGLVINYSTFSISVLQLCFHLIL